MEQREGGRLGWLEELAILSQWSSYCALHWQLMSRRARDLSWSAHLRALRQSRSALAAAAAARLYYTTRGDAFIISSVCPSARVTEQVCALIYLKPKTGHRERSECAEVVFRRETVRQSGQPMTDIDICRGDTKVVNKSQQQVAESA